jgi:hypothetical protein
MLKAGKTISISWFSSKYKSKSSAGVLCVFVCTAVENRESVRDAEVAEYGARMCFISHYIICIYICIIIHFCGQVCPKIGCPEIHWLFSIFGRSSPFSDTPKIGAHVLNEASAQS